MNRTDKHFYAYSSGEKETININYRMSNSDALLKMKQKGEFYRGKGAIFAGG